MSKQKNFYIVRFPQSNNSFEGSSKLTVPNLTQAYSKKQAVSYVITRIFSEERGRITNILKEQYNDLSNFAINLDEIQTPEVYEKKGEKERFLSHRGKDSHLYKICREGFFAYEVAKILGGKTQDYLSVTQEYLNRKSY
jgi:hypothetical protein